MVIFYRMSVIPINQTLANKLGTHEAAFYQLQNDQVIQIKLCSINLSELRLNIKNYKDINGIGTCFFLTMDRVERFDFTSFIWAEGFRLVLPRPGEGSRLFAFIRPFQPWVNLINSTNCSLTDSPFNISRFGCRFSPAFSSLWAP